MRKASSELLEQGIQAPSCSRPHPLNHKPRTYIRVGIANGGTSEWPQRERLTFGTKGEIIIVSTFVHRYLAHS